MKWVGAILLFVAAGLVFSFTQPLYAPEIFKALVTVVVTAGLVFAIAGPEDAPKKATDSLRMIIAVVVMLTGAIVVYSIFTIPLLGVLCAFLILCGTGLRLRKIMLDRGHSRRRN